MYAITGASGQLGTLVIDRLLAKVPADQIVATCPTGSVGGVGWFGGRDE